MLCFMYDRLGNRRDKNLNEEMLTEGGCQCVGNEMATKWKGGRVQESRLMRATLRRSAKGEWTIKSFMWGTNTWREFSGERIVLR